MPYKLHQELVDGRVTGLSLGVKEADAHLSSFSIAAVLITGSATGMISRSS